MLVAVLVMGVFWGAVSAFVQKNANGSPVTGFAWGFLLGAFGLGVVYLKAHRRNKRALAASV